MPSTALRYANLIVFMGVAFAAWFVIIGKWPNLMLDVYKRAVRSKGFEGPIPINTLATAPDAIFADPLHPPASATRLATTGVNHDTISTVGVLDLRKSPLVLHVPEMADRYYSVQFTSPNNTIFAYVGTRTTGSRAGTFLITGPRWRGELPGGMQRIASPHDSVFVLGRVLVSSDDDLPVASQLARQIRLKPA